MTDIVGYTNFYVSRESKTNKPSATLNDWVDTSSGAQTVYVHNVNESNYFMGVFPASDWERANSISFNIVVRQLCHPLNISNSTKHNVTGYQNFIEADNGVPITMTVDNNGNDFYQFSVSRANIEVVFTVLIWYGDVDMYISKGKVNTRTGYPDSDIHDWKDTSSDADDEITSARMIEISDESDSVCGDDDEFPCTYYIVMF